MIAAILSLLGSSAVGSLIGGIFALLNRKTDIDVKKLELAHEQSRWVHELAVKDKDIAYAQEEAKGKLAVAVIEGDAQTESARYAAIAISQQADAISSTELKEAGKWKGLLIVGIAMRSWIRPISTIILVASAIYLNWLLIGHLTKGWAAMTPDRQYEMGMQAFAWMTGQASAALSYWFVSRKSSG